jgi:hypothetical protein
MNGDPLTKDEIDTIREMKYAGKSTSEIAKTLGRSLRTIQRVSSNYVNGKIREKSGGVYFWLMKWWHWDVPYKPEPKPPSQFRTPYNYPRMWGGNDGRR